KPQNPKVGLIKLIIQNKMSTGVFADRASKNYIKQTNKQKKIVFGERPANISSHYLKFAQLSTSTSTSQVSNPDQVLGKVAPESANLNTSNIASPATVGAQQDKLKSFVSKSSFLSKLTDIGSNQEKSKGSGIPWYIVTQENQILNVFKITMGILSLPTVIINLLL
ncbi:MAG: hypothetical protein ACKO96_39685, partial [Flammeovirgaceae bacterium]